MYTINRRAWVVFGLAGLLMQCQSADNGAVPPETTPNPYEFKVPANFPEPVYAFENNAVTKEGFELGRMLFYDGRLSSDGSVSCGSCHRQAFAFADHSHDLSHGVGDKLGNRNTNALSNLAWMPEFFWDGGAKHLEVTPLNALTNPVEMNETLPNVIDKLNNLPGYREQFKAAFGRDTINSQLLFRALAQFTGSLVSANSRYDHFVRKEQGVVFTEAEQEGLRLFEAKCAACHATDLFTDHSYRNNGLDNDFARDKGREIVTSDPNDRGKFKVPSLRNVALTLPYMHDGRFYTLKRVLDHYEAGVKDSPTLDPLLRQNGRLGIPLTEDEKAKLIAFLNTLTDPVFANDKRFRDPLNNSNDQ
jgi:cytochrome c peroxidase